MQFSNMEDRLNPVSPPEADESTLGGYQAIHGRAAAFEGSDHRPYTVAVETELAEDGSWVGYLIFLQWAGTGNAIMGHMETGDLVHASTETKAREILEEWPLIRVKQLLERLLRDQQISESAG